MKKYFLNHKYLTIAYLLAAIFASFMTVCIAFIYQLLSEAATKGEMDHFIKIAVIALIYFFVEVISDYLPRLTSTRLVQSIMDSLRNDLIDHYMEDDLKKNIEESSSTRVAHVTNDLQIVETNFLRQLVYSVQVIAVFVFALFSSFLVNGLLASVMILLAFIPLVSPILSKHVLKGKRSNWQKKKNSYLKKFEEFSINLPFIKMSNATTRFKNRLTTSSNETKTAAIDFESSQGKTFTIIYGLGSIVYSGTWIVGGFFVLTNRATLPELIVMTTLMGTIAGPIQAFSTCYTEITSSKPIADQLLSIINEDKQEITRVNEISNIQNISLEHVSFGYKQSILTDINYVFNRGKTYAIKGKSGSGKSTLLELLMGIRQPAVGKIRMNETEINTIKRSSLFDQIAYIPQKTAIFEGTFVENVTLFQTADEVLLKESLRKTGLNKYIPNNNNEPLYLSSENKLSGGEERRLDIARGIYSDADVFIFDEPTSGLDQENENLISTIINEITDKIVIVVTHSENHAFIHSFDTVLQLKNNQLSEIKDIS